MIAPTRKDYSQYGISTLAWVGDAVYELEIRLALADRQDASSGRLNRQAVPLVSARGQAAIARAILSDRSELRLTEEERAIMRRGRNFHANSVSKNADPAEYRLATAFEALLGYLLLSGQSDRIAAIVRYGVATLQEASDDDTQSEP